MTCKAKYISFYFKVDGACLVLDETKNHSNDDNDAVENRAAAATTNTWWKRIRRGLRRIFVCGARAHDYWMRPRTIPMTIMMLLKTEQQRQQLTLGGKGFVEDWSEYLYVERGPMIECYDWIFLFFYVCFLFIFFECMYFNRRI